MWQKLKENKFLGYFSLFTSFGTLICCALPSMLVLLGFGATVAGFIGKYEELIWLSEHKEWVFGFSFLMLFLSYVAQKYSQKLACPIDQKENCENAKTWSKPIFITALVINLFGAFYAFVLPLFI